MKVCESLLLLSSLCLVGCASMKRRTNGTDVRYLVTDLGQEDLLRARVRCDRLVSVGGSTQTIPCTYGNTQTSVHSPISKLERNDVQAQLKQVADRRYELTKIRLISTQNTFAFAAEMTGITLSSVSAILGNPETKTILSTTSSLVQSLNTSVIKNFLANKTASSLINEMDALRADVETEIVAGSRKEVTDYGFEDAMRDAIRYDEAGTIHNAMIVLDKSSADTKTKAEAELKGEKKK